jgi:metal-responsive CopG/Arc/MetJ family transcriptional regulator
MAIRVSLEMRAEIDEWSAQQADRPDRSEAIRRMITMVLRGKRK